jgi:hypothetical protein
VPLFRRKNGVRLHQIGEAEAYGRSYGETSGDVRIVRAEPRRLRPQRKVTGEALRKAFLERLKRRDHSDRSGAEG